MPFWAIYENQILVYLSYGHIRIVMIQRCSKFEKKKNEIARHVQYT